MNRINVGRLCSAPGCTNNAHCKGLCPTHYWRVNTYGSYDLPVPTVVHIKHDYAEAEITDKHGKVVLTIMIDKDDAEFVSGLDLHMSHGYAVNKKFGALHRILLNCPSGMEVDHINRNRSDNRRSNLRVVTKEDNLRNIGKRKSNKSGYIGVSYRKDTGKWSAELSHSGIKYRLGCFSSKLCAAKAYDDKLRDLGDKYSQRNFNLT